MMTTRRIRAVDGLSCVWPRLRPRAARHCAGAVLGVLAATWMAGCETAPRERGVRRDDTASAPQADAAPGFLRQYAETNRFRSGRPNSIVIAPDGGTVYFLRSGGRDLVQGLYAWDAATGRDREVVTPGALLGGDGVDEELSPEEKARRERTRQSARGIASFELSKDGKSMLIPLSGRLFVLSLAEGAVRELRSGEGGAPAPIDARFSPDATRVAFVRGGEIWVTDVSSGAETRITSGAGESVSHGDAEFVAQEEMGRSHGYWWSPDSKWIAYQRTDVSKVEKVYISDPLNPFAEPRSWRYPRAGTPNAEVTLWVRSSSGGDPVELKWDREAYPYLATVKWERQRGLYVLVQNRLQTEQQMWRFAPPVTPGSSVGGDGGWPGQLVLSEQDPAWLNLDQDMPAFAEDVPGFFWTSEGAGWPDIEWRMEGPNSSEKRLVVGGELNVRSLVNVDFSRREALVLAAPAPNGPTETHLVSVEYRDGENIPTCLTCQWPGVHAAKVSKDGSTIVLSTTPAQGAFGVRVFRRAEGERGLGREIGMIASRAEAPAVTPRVEWTTVGGGAGVGGRGSSEPVWHAALVRPSTFRQGQRLPVLCSVYTGPTSQTVMRTGVSFALDQWAAEHGFIVVRIDNRGTPGRGRDWERMTRGNLIDLQLQDQTAALKRLGERYPELDLSRVGVYGWSFGGYYAAMAACRRPDVYHAACAGAPVTDWADYDTHYTERYLGLPAENAEGYRIGNVMTWAKDLRRPLLLIHGSADDNVYFTHSLKLMEAALREGTSEWIEFLPLAGQTHMVTEPAVVERMYGRMMGFFRERLLSGAAERVP